MYKKIFFIFTLVIIIPTIVTANKPKPTIYSNQKNIAELQTKYDDLNDKYTKLEEKYKEKLAETYFENVLGAFGVAFTAISIFIGLLTIGIPIWVWLSGIKPSKDAIKNLEKNFEKRINDYFDDLKKREVKESFDGLKSNDNLRIIRAYNYLSSTNYNDFNKEQLFEMYSLCKNFKIHSDSRRLFASILLLSESEFAKELFTNPEYASVYRNPLLLYISKTGYENNYEYLEAILKGSRDQFLEFGSILSNIKDNKLPFDKTFISFLTKETREKVKSQPYQIISNVPGSRKDIIQRIKDIY